MQRTRSAGGIVLNARGDVLVVSQRGRSWSLPKGHINPGEKPLAAARREIYEESGLKDLEYADDLGSYVRYRILPSGRGEDRRERKRIYLFLFRTPAMLLQPVDPHNPEARWVRPERVATLLSHPRDAAFFRRILRSGRLALQNPARKQRGEQRRDGHGENE